MRIRFALSLLFCGLPFLPGWAEACTSTKMKTTESGFIFKVVGGSDKVQAIKEPGSAETAFILDLLAPYFVICEDDQFYRITDLPAETVEQAQTGKVGYVPKDQVFPWPTREALNFSAIVNMKERPEIIAWDDRDLLKKFLVSGNLALGPPTYKEDMNSTLKRERQARPYPVLSSTVEKMLGTKDKRVFDVLLPAALPPDAKVVIDTGATKTPGQKTATKETKEVVTQKIDKAMTNATFVIAFDATGSMAPFAKEVAGSIRTAFESLPADVQKASKIGFVFFRDKDDKEKFVIIPPNSVADAVTALQAAATETYMTGGGDAAEPVLDAVYIAHHLYPWSGPGSEAGAGGHGQGGGKKIMIAVLSDDAKATTLGEINDKVPPGLEPARIASDLLADSIPLISVQAGPRQGPLLVPVLSQIGEGSGGTFIEWGKGGDELAQRVSQALAAQLKERAEKTYVEGKADLKKLEFDLRGYATIPLAVMDPEKLGRLRDAGIKFNIDPGKGGVLIRRGVMLQNDDLLDPVISIDKKTLEGLVNLFSRLGATGIDVKAMQESAAQALAAIAGEDYDPKETIATTIKKRLGIQFRSKLLDFDLNYLAGLTQSERLELSKRIQDASKSIARFHDAHLDDWSKLPTVWMPVSELP